jgi:hypothetical protein
MNEGQPGRPAAALIRAALTRAALVPVALAVAALLATACGGSHPARSAASPGAGNVQQLDVFAACMRGHGVLNFYFTNSRPSSTSPALSVMGHYVTGVNPQTATFVAAMKACKHLLPGGGPPPITQKQIDSMVKFAACMRSHGYPDYPDPIVQNGGVEESPLPSSIDTSSAQFLAAEKTCGNS